MPSWTSDHKASTKVEQWNSKPCSLFFVAAVSFLHLAPCCYLPLLVHILENIYFDAYVSLQAECLFLM